MRKLLCGAAGLALITAGSACDNTTATPKAAPVDYVLAPIALPGVVTACYGLTVTGPASARFAAGVRYSEGVPTAETQAPATLAEAEAQGALCHASIDATHLALDVCDPDGATLGNDLVLVGIYDSDGASVAPYKNPCTLDAPCHKDSHCTTDAAVPSPAVELELTIMRESNQGFFDISAYPTIPGTFTDVCYALRVDNADGDPVVVSGELCASMYGVATTGDVTYISTCDAARSPNTATLWITRVAWTGAAPTWTNPCPAPSGAVTEEAVKGWTGGCPTESVCRENADSAFTAVLEAGSGVEE